MFRVKELLSYLATLDELLSDLPDVGAKLEASRLKMFHNFHFLQSDMVFGITNPFSRIFHAVSRKKSCPISC